MQTFWQNLRNLWQPEGTAEETARSSAQNDLFSPKFSIDWVLPQQLAVGAFPEAEHLEILHHQGVQSIISLCAPTEAQLAPKAHSLFTCVQFTLPDSRTAAPLTCEDLATAVDLVRQSVMERGMTYVHCLAGVERSPTVCMAYLCRYHHLQLWEALNWLKEIHPRTGVTSEQLRVITDYVRLG